MWINWGMFYIIISKEIKDCNMSLMIENLKLKKEN